MRARIAIALLLALTTCAAAQSDGINRPRRRRVRPSASNAAAASDMTLLYSSQTTAAAAADGDGTAPTAYKLQARRNLTTWQSRLFATIMTAYKQADMVRYSQDEPRDVAIFKVFNPVVSCPDAQAPVRIGSDGDGGKFVCVSELKQPGCVVYSLGSNGDFAFEDDVLKQTQCSVVTFDCTSPARANTTRHTFVSKCIGSADKQAADPASWITLASAREQLGHGAVTYMKMDIEGSEYDVVAHWTPDNTDLPLQLGVEVHVDGLYCGTTAFRSAQSKDYLLWPLHKVKLSELALFMDHLANLGYAVASREDNAISLHCSEFLFVRVV